MSGNLTLVVAVDPSGHPDAIALGAASRATRLDLSQQSHAVLTFELGESVFDPGGASVSLDQLEAELPSESCGRCRFPNVTTPMVILEGDACAPPETAITKTFDLEGDQTELSPGLVENVRRLVRVTRAGACQPNPRAPKLAPDVLPCALSPRGLPPLSFAQNRAGAILVLTIDKQLVWLEGNKQLPVEVPFLLTHGSRVYFSNADRAIAPYHDGFIVFDWVRLGAIVLAHRNSAHWVRRAADGSFVIDRIESFPTPFSKPRVHLEAEDAVWIGGEDRAGPAIARCAGEPPVCESETVARCDSSLTVALFGHDRALSQEGNLMRRREVGWSCESKLDLARDGLRDLAWAARVGDSTFAVARDSEGSFVLISAPITAHDLVPVTIHAVGIRPDVTSSIGLPDGSRLLVVGGLAFLLDTGGRARRLPPSELGDVLGSPLPYVTSLQEVRGIGSFQALRVDSAWDAVLARRTDRPFEVVYGTSSRESRGVLMRSRSGVSRLGASARVELELGETCATSTATTHELTGLDSSEEIRAAVSMGDYDLVVVTSTSSERAPFRVAKLMGTRYEMVLAHDEPRSFRSVRAAPVSDHQAVVLDGDGHALILDDSGGLVELPVEGHDPREQATREGGRTFDRLDVSEGVLWLSGPDSLARLRPDGQGGYLGEGFWRLRLDQSTVSATHPSRTVRIHALRAVEPDVLWLALWEGGDSLGRPVSYVLGVDSVETFPGLAGFEEDEASDLRPPEFGGTPSAVYMVTGGSLVAETFRHFELSVADSSRLGASVVISTPAGQLLTFSPTEVED